MRSINEVARHMIERYGADAEIHCTYNVMNNEGKNADAVAHWRAVLAALKIIRNRGH